MPRNRKYFINKSVHFCTSRTETGLPFVATQNMNFLLKGVLARASELYDVSVCHHVFMANHFHMLIVVNNPEHVSAFFGYVKTESSHIVNRLLGRRQRTIWEDGYDSPPVLTVDKAEHYVKYIYLNPARADLVESITQYPGVSSWEMFRKGVEKEAARRLQRSSLIPLPTSALSINEQKRLVEKYKKLPGEEHVFTLEANAWMECFEELKGVRPEEINAKLFLEIEEAEHLLSEKREKEGRTVIGATKLKRESMEKEYVPEKRSLRMICLSSCKELRKRFIEHYRALCEEARLVYLAWKEGDTARAMPPGLFAPRMPTLCSAFQVT